MPWSRPSAKRSSPSRSESTDGATPSFFANSPGFHPFPIASPTSKKVARILGGSIPGATSEISSFIDLGVRALGDPASVTAKEPPAEVGDVVVGEAEAGKEAERVGLCGVVSLLPFVPVIAGLEVTLAAFATAGVAAPCGLLRPRIEAELVEALLLADEPTVVGMDGDLVGDPDRPAVEAFRSAHTLRWQGVAVPLVLLAALVPADAAAERVDWAVPVDELGEDLLELVVVLVRAQEHAGRQGAVKDAPGIGLRVPDVADADLASKSARSSLHRVLWMDEAALKISVATSPTVAP